MTKSVALYRKYRGRTLAEIVGQEHITKPLTNAIAANHISHAYLFTGPHGVGKTSVARILAHEISKLPYDEQSEHLDIIEIDAASNRRIDEIRDLREKVHIAPSSAKYKVYIIDEVHMLTREAFNALLKTLEEPPKHVVFILATTEAHKLPGTIISRTQRHSFKPIQTADAVKHLKDIAKKEHIKITDDALELLAQHGKGSFRDSISLLDQIARSHTDQIDVQHIQSMLGLTSNEIIGNILHAAHNGDLNGILTVLDRCYQNGVTAGILSQQLIENIRSQQRLGTTANASSLKLIEDLITVGISPKPDIKLETILLRYTLEHSTKNTQNTITQQEKTVQQSQPKTEKISTPKIKTAPKSKSMDEKPSQPLSAPAPSISKSATDLSKETWHEIVSSIKKYNNALHAVIKSAKPLIDDENHVILAFPFAFHKKQAEQKKNIALLQEILSQTLQKPVKVELVVDDTANASNSTVQEAKARSIIDTFGGGEVLTNE